MRKKMIVVLGLFLALIWSTNIAMAGDQCPGTNCVDISTGSWLWSEGTQDKDNRFAIPKPGKFKVSGFSNQVLNAEGYAGPGAEVTYNGQLTTVNDFMKEATSGDGTIVYQNLAIEDIWGGFKVYGDCPTGNLYMDSDRTYDFTGKVDGNKQWTNLEKNTSVSAHVTGKETYAGANIENVDTYFLTGPNGQMSGFQLHSIKFDITKP